MNPLSLILGGTSLLGGLLGHKKGIDMRAWERLFGPQAMAALTNQFMQQYSNSPFARQQMVGAANTGQQIANNFAAMPGARTSGVGQISQALAGGATNSLQAQLQAMLYQMAQQSAQQNMAQKQDIFLQNQQTPSFLQQLGPALSGASSQVLSMLPQKTAVTTPTPAPSVLNRPYWTPSDLWGGGGSNNALSFFDQFNNRAVGAR